MEYKKLFSNIKFWILLFFLIRLIGITNPPLEVGHNWRQTTVTMVSRNFYEVDNNIFLPRIDIAGEKSGITGMEFPLLNYLVYLVAELFGYDHWYGRLINLIISSLGLWFFYLLLRKYFDKNVAFYSTIILIVSIWFQFSRKVMPDTFSMSLIIAGIYYGTNYLEKVNKKKQYLYLFSYFILTLLGILSKLPSAYLLVIFSIFLFDKKISLTRKFIFSLVSVFCLIPVAYWYFIWVPHLVEEYGFWHFFMGKSFKLGITEIYENLSLTLSRFYDTALKFIGFGVFIYGLIISIIKKQMNVIIIFILSFLSFSVIIFKAGFTFSHHNYYIIPFVPVMTLIAGYGISKIPNIKVAYLLLLAIAVEGISNQHHDFRVKEKELKILNLEEDLDKFSSRDDLILINSGLFPTPMYFAHRRGWVNTNEKISNETYIKDLKQKGLKYIVVLKRSFGADLYLNKYQVMLNTEDYTIYRI